MKNTRTVIFPCECGDPLHELRVKVWSLDDTLKCDVKIMPRGKLTWRGRLGAAWRILRRGELPAEWIFLNQTETERLLGFVGEAVKQNG